MLRPYLAGNARPKDATFCSFKSLASYTSTMSINNNNHSTTHLTNTADNNCSAQNSHLFGPLPCRTIKHTLCSHIQHCVCASSLPPSCTKFADSLPCSTLQLSLHHSSCTGVPGARCPVTLMAVSTPRHHTSRELRALVKHAKRLCVAPNKVAACAAGFKASALLMP